MHTLSWTSIASRIPVLAVVAVAVVVLAQNGCSGSSDNGAANGGDASTGDCRPGEAMTDVNGVSLCCAGAAPSLICYSPGGPRAGDPCSAGATATESSQAVRLDVCINDACNGDRTPATYVAKDEGSIQSLSCVNGTFQASGGPSTHEVDRVCNDVTPLLCSGTTYGYYGYQTSYGYSYYGGQELVKRAVSVLSSTCAQGSAAPTPCDVGSL